MRKKRILYISFFILQIIILLILIFFTLKNLFKKLDAYICMQSSYNFESTSPFSINKIVYFSSANCSSNVNENSSFAINNLYQYTDIAIFLNNNSEYGFTSENTLKNVKISNINFYLKPSIGEPNLYYKNINDFTHNSYDSNNLINNSINFNVSSQNEIDYNTPTLFNNCANPITLCYVNGNIINNYTLSNDISNLSYDGSLLKNCNITLNSISCKLSFEITITNNKNETYYCPLILTLPLSTENNTIYDGSLTFNSTVNYNFLKV